ncbi:MAG: HD domain-containing protein [Candidatus Shapirobacteria bacterium]|nr:HD domain-containing protein [Candidatus Shapirobacteria bacterium]MDD3002773.1 HD domain-containing protein [Candidatus Shapirobacteria bacterium]MDD4383503.1 HD domain-containing protein [Candidatus Shapirobacteria bacterium]
MGLDLSFSDNYWEDLERYLVGPNFNKELIKKAYDFMDVAHEGQKRYSGKPYISHPSWIAKVVAQLNIGQEAVIAALLHDCVEDTNVKINDIAKEFGDEVALLVSGLTEVKTKTKGLQINQTNIEIFRKFFFSSINDVRVLILRLIDKLHNSLTIEYLPKERQLIYAKNIMRIYGPLAEYVGLHYFKKLLEDRAFRVLYEDEASKIKEMFKERSKDEIKALNLIENELESILKINNINGAIVEGRIKSLYSTYLKIKRKGEKYQVKDRVAIRVLTDNLVDCYTVLGLLHAKYKYIPEEFEDYISSPKPNGYRSIQTTVNWKDKMTVEIQIKTKEMHDFNEFGPASHIAYKMGTEVLENGRGMEWVKDLVKWQKGDNNVNNYRIKVLTNYVYVFTPKGDTIQLPKGCVALDFAYRIHTSIGDRCKGIKINGKMARIDDELKTGDLIEVLLGKKINVNKNWLDVVKTQWAREHIRKMVKFDQ